MAGAYKCAIGQAGSGWFGGAEIGLAAVAFGAVALAAEDLKVLESAGASLGMWDDVVHVQRSILTGDAAQGAPTATGLEHLEPHRTARRGVQPFVVPDAFSALGHIVV